MFVCGNLPEPGAEISANALHVCLPDDRNGRHVALGELALNVTYDSFEPNQSGFDVTDGEQVFHLHSGIESRLDRVIKFATNAGVHALDCGGTLRGTQT